MRLESFEVDKDKVLKTIFINIEIGVGSVVDWFWLGYFIFKSLVCCLELDIYWIIKVDLKFKVSEVGLKKKKNC